MPWSKTATPDNCIRLVCEGPFAAQGEEVNPLVSWLDGEAAGRTVLVDLEKTTSLNSTGVLWFLETQRYLQEKGGKLILYSLPPVVDNVLRLLGLEKILCLAGDARNALRLARGGVS